MEKFVKIIYDYMSSNRRLTVAGLGTFISKGAGSPIIFSEFIKEDDGVLRGVLVSGGMGDFMAGEAIDRFVEEVYGKLIEGDGECDLGVLGVIRVASIPEHYRSIIPIERPVAKVDRVEVAPLVEPVVESVAEPTPAPEPKSEIKEVVDPIFTTPTPSAEGAPKRKIDFVMIFSILVGLFALGVLVYSFVVSWMIGDIVLPEPFESAMERIMFGDYEATIDTLNVMK